MGSIAQDKKGNMALGYSVSNGTTVFPGIRYTGRLRNDAANQMPQGEADHLGPRLADPDRRLPDARLHLSDTALVARRPTRHTGGRGGLVASRRHRRP
jgi:hypothetical protein